VSLLVVLLGLLSPRADAQVYYPDFSNTTGLDFYGSALPKVRDVVLTERINDQRGAVWVNRRMPLGDGFAAYFDFSILDIDGAGIGADGFAFVINNSGFALGGNGGGLGYHGIPNSLAVEFDTYDNDYWEGDVRDRTGHDNHVAVHSRGYLFNEANWFNAGLAINYNIPNLSDGRRHSALVRYVPGLLEVYIDNCDNPYISLNVRLDSLLGLENGTDAFVGFTSSTGSKCEMHVIHSFFLNAPSNIRDTVVAPADAFCPGSTYTLQPPNWKGRYEWAKGGPVVKDSGTYVLNVYDTTSVGCFSTMYRQRTWIKSLEIYPSTHPKIAGPDTVCIGGYGELKMPKFYSRYRWSNGDTSSVLHEKAGSYWADVMNMYGCWERTDTVRIVERPEPIPNISGMDSVCFGHLTVLSADSGHTSYLWSTGDRTRSITAGAGRYSVTVIDSNGCVGTSEWFWVTEHAEPDTTLFIDKVTICRGDSAMIATRGWYKDHRWSNGATTPFIVVTEPGPYWLSFTDSNGCVWASDTVFLTVVDPDSIQIVPSGSTALCEGDEVILKAYPAGLSYVWSTGDTTDEIKVSRTGVYTLNVRSPLLCPVTPDSIEVVVTPITRPVIECWGDTLIAHGGSGPLWWYRDGVWVAEADSILIPDLPGRYSVEEHDTLPCTHRSGEYTWSLTSTRLPQIETQSGDTITVTLMLDTWRTADSLGATRWQGGLIYNPLILLPIDFPNSIGEESIEIAGTRKIGDSVLTSVRFLVLLGDTNYTSLDHWFQWSDVCSGYSTALGYVHLNDDCYTSHRRMVPMVWTKITRVFPNPMEGRLTIEFTNSEPGYHELLLFNSAGQMVTMVTQGHFDAGVHTVVYNGALAAGRYMLVLKGLGYQDDVVIFAR
jgi:hypothetical protein